MAEKYRLQKLKPTEFNLLIPLMKACFGLSVNTDYFEWKFLKNPAGSFIGYIAVTVENEVVAYYGVIPEVYSFNGIEKTIYQSCDTMTHPNHRRKGLFQKLATHCYSYLKKNDKLFIIGFSGEKSTPGFIKFGWEKVCVMRNYFFPKQINFFESNLGLEDVSEHENPLEISGLFYNSNKDIPIHIVKSEKFVKWRLSNPLYSYKTFSLNKSYICFYESTNKIVLFDFSFDKSSDAKILFRFIKREMKKLNSRGIIVYCQENSIKSRLIKKYGFIANPLKKGPLSYRTPFIIYTDNKHDSFLINPVNWSLGSFDHDAM